MSAKLLPLKIIPQTNKKPNGAVIFFHGSGDTGEGACEWVKFLLKKNFQFPHLQIIFPQPHNAHTHHSMGRYFYYRHALNSEDGGNRVLQNIGIQLQHYINFASCHVFNVYRNKTIRSIQFLLSHVWFDRISISPDVPEHTETLQSAGKDVTNFIQQEVVKADIPESNIIIGGFSMGGALAMHIGFQLMPKVAGVFALSSFLSHTSSIYQSLQSIPQDVLTLPPLFMCHGDRDTLVPHEWGEHTFKTLKQLGVNGEFHTIPNALHELKEKELQQLCEWINQCLPPPP